MSPLEIAEFLVDLLLKLVGASTAKDMLDQRAVIAANAAADLAEREKFGGSDGFGA